MVCDCCDFAFRLIPHCIPNENIKPDTNAATKNMFVYESGIENRLNVCPLKGAKMFGIAR